MNLNALKEIVAQAINELQGQRARPSWIAERAMRIADPERVAPASIAFAANLEFRQLARERLRDEFEPENPEEHKPKQDRLFPGLQAMYPRRVAKDEEPEYVRPELLTAQDVMFNIARMRSGAEALQRGADALEAFARERGLFEELAA